MFKSLIKRVFLPPVKKQQKSQQERVTPVSSDLQLVKEQIEQTLGVSPDLVLRKILIANGTTPALVVYLDNMIDKRMVNEGIIAPLQKASPEDLANAKQLAYSALAATRVKLTTNFDKVIGQILKGETAIFISGFMQALVAGTTGYETRGIQPPQVEVNIEGPKDALVESLDINVTLIRRRLRDPNLRLEKMTIGTRSRTDVLICHIKGLADPDIVQEVKKRLQAIQVDGLQAMEMLHEYLSDCPLSIFPTALKSERPEQGVSCLLEGRVAIMADGYPFIITVPTTFAQFMQAGDDYYQSFYQGTFLRWLRYFSYLITLTLPSLYIALVTHHWEMLPTDLALTIAGSREGIPFPVVVEVLAMEITFEILREAGIRLPKAVGQAVSIAGALVIGQSAVEAGLVSPGIVIIVAFTGIASFTLPKYVATIPIRLLRFPLMLITSQVGLPGLVSGVLIIWSYMNYLTSFGVPYMAPITPLQGKDLKDTLFRLPRWTMIHRPQSVPSMDPVREKPIIPPGGKPNENE